MQTLYKEWAKGCLPIAIFATIILTSSLPAIGWAMFLIWMQFPCYLLHEFEEHVYPGGFKSFINQRIFQSVTPNIPLNDANVFWINIPFIWVTFPFFAILAQHVNIQFGAILPYLALFNATTHIIAALVKRHYNPGLIVSVLINYPTGIYTLIYLSQQHLLRTSTHWYAFLFALVGHIALVMFIVIKNARLKKLTV